MVYTPEGKMAGGVRLAMYLSFVLNLVKCVATRLLSVCLHGVALGGLHVLNGILKFGGIQHDNMDRRDRLAHDWIQDLVQKIVIKCILYREGYK